MNLEKTKLPRLLASIISVVAVVVGLVLIGILPAINLAGGPATFGDFISQFIHMIKNISSIDPGMIALYLHSIANIVVYVVTYIVGLVFLIKCIVSLAKFNKEGSAKRIAFDSLKLSFVLLTFFGLSIFFNCGLTASVAVGGYLALALGAVATLCALANYFFVSERVLLNKCLRICFVVVALTASIFALMPTITMSDAPAAPGLFLLSTIQSVIAGGTVDSLMISIAVIKFVLFVVAYSFASRVATTAVDERKKNDGRSVLSIVLSAVALALVLGALFGVRLAIDSNAIGISIFGIISIVLMTLTLGLAILVFVLTKKEEQSIPAEAAQPSEEKEEPAKVEEEPQEEEPVEEEAPAKEEEAEVAPVVAPVEEAPEEKAEEPVKEEKEKPAPKKKEEPKKAEPKKEAKKPESKKEADDKDAKKNASYHLSKRASDNKWQVFRAGSDKVIKLFDTKVEAEEYTKRMAENQGVGYLSHASKGKNKGRIQKK